MSLENILLVITGTLTSLLAGLFYGYAVSVNGGLGRLKDAGYVAAMQSINIAILNPLFFLIFMGPVILLPIATLMHRSILDSDRFILLLFASVLYIMGVFGVTAAGNVPLNNRLARIELSKASDQEITRAREEYERPWNRLHTIRTLAAVIAATLVFAACVAT
jgi:uncharacterized membrane protein